jgi:aminoglycoside phosphotransferase (APT) family kinase protein
MRRGWRNGWQRTTRGFRAADGRAIQGAVDPTYKLVTPGRFYVLRRKQPGQLPKGAHAVEREARVLSALGTVGFPVAHVDALCTDEASSAPGST